MLLVISFVLGACSTVQIPDVPIYKELPFSGKALEVYTVSDKYRIIEKDEWAKMVPYGLIIMPDGWAEIKKAWLRACLIAGNKCKQHVQAVSDFVAYLDKIFESTYKGVH